MSRKTFEWRASRNPCTRYRAVVLGVEEIADRIMFPSGNQSVEWCSRFIVVRVKARQRCVTANRSATNEVSHELYQRTRPTALPPPSSSSFLT